ncbi:hypothetical protein J6590_050376 [Homalodisca vitripennis]|nr:hypothetical protein J6590_050376 [Homalodisca vitripennis]
MCRIVVLFTGCHDDAACATLNTSDGHPYSYSITVTSVTTHATRNNELAHSGEEMGNNIQDPPQHRVVSDVVAVYSSMAK